MELEHPEKDVFRSGEIERQQQGHGEGQQQAGRKREGSAVRAPAVGERRQPEQAEERRHRQPAAGADDAQQAEQRGFFQAGRPLQPDPRRHGGEETGEGVGLAQVHEIHPRGRQREEERQDQRGGDARAPGDPAGSQGQSGGGPESVYRALFKQAVAGQGEQRAVHIRQQRRLGVAEVPVGHLALPHGAGGGGIETLVRIQRAVADEKKGGRRMHHAGEDQPTRRPKERDRLHGRPQRRGRDTSRVTGP